nr:hypothetical protein GCM10025730_45330 [Promicromonospora thailandica]
MGVAGSRLGPAVPAAGRCPRGRRLPVPAAPRTRLGPGRRRRPAAPGGPGQFPAPAAPSRSARREVEDEWDEEEDEGPQYTWLHYIILVVVAFVLGLLIWKLVLEGDSAITDEQAAALLGSLPGFTPGGHL